MRYSARRGVVASRCAAALVGCTTLAACLRVAPQRPPPAAAPRAAADVRQPAVTPADAGVAGVAVVFAPPACPAPANSVNGQDELPPGAPASLVVANESGVRELNMDGTVRRVLSTTPASRPRWGAGQRSVFFLVPGRGELRSLALDTCEERAVAVLPRGVGAGCGGFDEEGYDPVGAVQDDGDFAVVPDAGVACLMLMDANANSATGIVAMQVSLADGAVRSAVRAGERCREEPAPQPCGGVFGDPPAPPTAGGHGEGVAQTPLESDAALPYRADGARIVRRGADGREHPAGRIAADDVDEESVSPSGRWVLLRANLEQGDLIYRQLFLFDRREGGVYPVRDGAWPAALTTRQLANRRVVREAGARVTGETPVRWLPGADLLVVGTVLSNPGHRSVRLDGDLAL